ncbi:MAG: DUF21 domain-containing protein [Thiobacillus sp.]|nr:DUF21 domain-containing protein [Thiobacillus sp.]MDP2252651.1 DUF21 domain-containing protein [Thiobacillus sp.]MDP2979552.1 DUF21 domain-containing protein [Thiobacillus sp.]
MMFATVVITIVGEIVPQAWFSRHALKVAGRLAPLLRFYRLLLWPVAWPSGSCSMPGSARRGSRTRARVEGNSGAARPQHARGATSEIAWSRPPAPSISCRSGGRSPGSPCSRRSLATMSSIKT